MKVSANRRRARTSAFMASLVIASVLQAASLHAQTQPKYWPATVFGLSGDNGTEHHYEVKFPGTGRSNLRFTLLPPVEPQVYVKFGAPPTRSDYDCRSSMSDIVNSCRIGSLKAGTYHVMLIGNARFSDVGLDVKWNSGVAVSSGQDEKSWWMQGWQLHQPTRLLNFSGETGTSYRYWVAFPSAEGLSDLTVTVLSKKPEVFVKLGERPTEGNYDCRSYMTDIVNSCRIGRPQHGTYHVMVRGNAPFSDAALDVSWDSVFAD